MANGKKMTPSSTPVRNTPVPRAASPSSTSAKQQPRQISHDQIAKRAYEISQSGNAGSETDNWLRAERELRGS